MNARQLKHWVVCALSRRVVNGQASLQLCKALRVAEREAAKELAARVSKLCQRPGSLESVELEKARAFPASPRNLDRPCIQVPAAAGLWAPRTSSVKKPQDQDVGRSGAEACIGGSCTPNSTRKKRRLCKLENKLFLSPEAVRICGLLSDGFAVKPGRSARANRQRQHLHFARRLWPGRIMSGRRPPGVSLSDAGA